MSETKKEHRPCVCAIHPGCTVREELLTALKQMLEYAADGIEPPTRPNRYLVERVRAAIAKAEGRGE